MGRIRILDDHIANQIAAGEVVERPASVVKELVENAIDAGADYIEVSAEEGGLSLIRVKDNGAGIHPEDVETAFLRHATSKISTGKDLFAIRTLGFRGEALPSIAAVAKVECRTSATDDGLGRRILIEGGKIVDSGDEAVPRGTEITVRELFYNTPARLKYMKSVQTELGHISDYLYRLALAHPDISFTLRHGSNVLLQSLGNGDLRQAIAAVYGTSTAKAMIPVSGESLDYRLDGFISKPEFTRANRNGITVTVNGRVIRSPQATQALLAAYHTLLPIGRFPVAVLRLKMDPSLVDVNVHPSKLEVRFSKEAELMEIVRSAAFTALTGMVHIPSGAASRPGPARPAAVQEQLELYRAPAAPEIAAASSPAPLRGTIPADRTAGAAAPAYGRPAASGAGETIRPSAQASRPTAYGAKREADRPPIGYPAPTGGSAGAERRLEAAGRWLEREVDLARQAAEPPRDSAGRSGEAGDAAPDALAESPASAGRGPGGLPAFPLLSPIGQLHGTYIVAQNDRGLYLIDQHAAHERINYEWFYDRFGRPGDAVQPLLVPIPLEFTAAEAAVLTDRLDLLRTVGVELEPFGPNSFLIRALPHWLPEGREQEIVEEMIRWLMEERNSIEVAKLREKSAILCSCKASIKANEAMTVTEMEALLDRLGRCRQPYTCPHGRPIVVSFSVYELEKMFKRVM